MSRDSCFTWSCKSPRICAFMLRGVVGETTTSSWFEYRRLTFVRAEDARICNCIHALWQIVGTFEILSLVYKICWVLHECIRCRSQNRALSFLSFFTVMYIKLLSTKTYTFEAYKSIVIIFLFIIVLAVSYFSTALNLTYAKMLVTLSYFVFTVANYTLLIN